MSDAWQLAQINVARLLVPQGEPQVQPFFDALARINAVADAAPGFVWRLQGDGGDATDIAVGDDPRLIVNLSVWESPEALFDFVYRSAHTPVMARRRQWFEKRAGAHQALWWVPTGHRPGVDEGMARLARLDRDGPTPAAFTFKLRFPPPDAPGAPQDMWPERYCEA
jgi:hypothetical protein